LFYAFCEREPLQLSIKTLAKNWTIGVGFLVEALGMSSVSNMTGILQQLN
jgi:hypothetical protein